MQVKINKQVNKFVAYRELVAANTLRRSTVTSCNRNRTIKPGIRHKGSGSAPVVRMMNIFRQPSTNVIWSHPQRRKMSLWGQIDLFRIDNDASGIDLGTGGGLNAYQAVRLFEFTLNCEFFGQHQLLPFLSVCLSPAQLSLFNVPDLRCVPYGAIELVFNGRGCCFFFC